MRATSMAVIPRHAPRARPLNVVLEIRILLYIGSFDPLSVLDLPRPSFPLALPSNHITSSSTLRLPSRSRIQPLTLLQ